MGWTNLGSLTCAEGRCVERRQSFLLHSSDQESLTRGSRLGAKELTLLTELSWRPAADARKPQSCYYWSTGSPQSNPNLTDIAIQLAFKRFASPTSTINLRLTLGECLRRSPPAPMSSPWANQFDFFHGLRQRGPRTILLVSERQGCSRWSSPNHSSPRHSTSASGLSPRVGPYP